MVIVRKAHKQDIEHLLPLMAQLGYPTNLDMFKKRFDSFLNLDGYGIGLACLNDQIIGFVAWSKSNIFVIDKIRIHIEALVVNENYRNQGIGKKLIDFIEEFAQQFSPVVIDLTSGIRRAKDGSHDFYKKLGYKNEGHMAKLYFRKEL
jgi:GNAT superfamily N-acetyltransferase